MRCRGAERRSFISGMRLWPPARSLASSPNWLSSVTASGYDFARWHSNARGYIPPPRPGDAGLPQPLLPEHVPCDEDHVGGALRQASHEVRIPLRPERNIDAQAVAFAHQLLLQIATHAMQHLKLIRGVRDVLRARELFYLGDDLLVVCGNAMEDAALQQRARQLQVVRIRVGLLGERDFRRLFVRALAQADANAL